MEILAIPVHQSGSERSADNVTVPTMNTTRHTAIPPSEQASVWLPSLRRSLLAQLATATAAGVAVSLALVGMNTLDVSHAAKFLALFCMTGWLVWRALEARVGATGTPTHPYPHPYARLGPANSVTLVRLTLTLFLAALVGERLVHAPIAAMAETAWILVVVATATALLDAVDGHLARRSGMASAFGARFDMETDAFFILVLCALVVQAGQVGPWVIASGLMRYAFIGAARLWPWLSGPLHPSKRRQTVCVVQITTLIVCLGPIISPSVATVLAAISLVMLAVSFAIDVHALARQRATFQEI